MTSSPDNGWSLPDEGRGMTLSQAEHAAARAFSAAGIEDELLEAEVLLRHVLKLDRAAYFARTLEPISHEQAQAYEEVVRRRLGHEPTAYITAHREFYALDFEVSPDALIPRPETEMLVEATLARVAGKAAPLVVDVGSGCGAIAVAVAVNNAGARVMATDVSRGALRLTRSNARRHGVASRVWVVQADLMAGLDANFDAIVSNLPYVRTSDWQTLEPEIREHEPRQALDGGPDGLDLVRRLLLQAAPFVAAGAALYAEIGYDEGEAAIASAAAAMPWAKAGVRQDFAGRDRMLLITRD